MKIFLKKIYNSIPFKKQVFSALKGIWTPKERIYKHLHFRGTFRVKVDENHSFFIMHHGYQVENQVFWKGLTGSYEMESLKLWIKLSRLATSIVDVGANTGIYSLTAKSLQPESKVYAFEPVKRVYDKLVFNNRINAYDIISIEAALSDFDGTATIYDTGTEHTYSVTVNKNRNEPETPVYESKIKVMRLSTFIEQNNIQKIELIKIDVETHEKEVLKGFGRYLQVYKPSILIEILNEEVALQIQSVIEGIPYLYFNISEKSGPRLVEKLSQSDGYNFLICQRNVATELGLIN